MKVSIDKIIPFSKARNSLSKLMDQVQNDQYFIISKQNSEKKAVLVDLDYFAAAQDALESAEMGKVENELQDVFLNYAKKKLKKSKITEEEAYKLITGEELSW